ncbi:MAG: hypothetical protein SGPRY_010072 [Prymnesium sp.]
MEAAQDLVKIVPTAKVDDATMAGFLGQLMQKIRTLRACESLLVPLNLQSSDGSEAVLLSLRRKSASFFSFAVVAAGPSLQYHAVTVDEGTAEFRHNTAAVLEAVPAERLIDSSFCYASSPPQLGVNGHFPSSDGTASICDDLQRSPVSNGEVTAQTALLLTPPFVDQLAGGLVSPEPAGYFTGWLNARRKALFPAGMATDGARFLYETLLPFLNSRPSPRTSPLLEESAPLPPAASRPVSANVNLSKADFTPLPAGGEAGCAMHLVTEAMRHVLRGVGFNGRLAAQVVVIARWTLLRMAEADLRAMPRLAPSEAEVLRAATRQLATVTAEERPSDLIVRAVSRTISEITERLADLGADAAEGQDPASLPLPRSATSAAGACSSGIWLHISPLLLRRDTDVEQLAGESQPRQILLPVELTRVPEVVASFSDAAKALRRCEALCSLLSNQQHLVRNSLHLSESTPPSLLTFLTPRLASPLYFFHPRALPR